MARHPGSIDRHGDPPGASGFCDAQHLVARFFPCGGNPPWMMRFPFVSRNSAMGFTRPRRWLRASRTTFGR